MMYGYTSLFFPPLLQPDFLFDLPKIISTLKGKDLLLKEQILSLVVIPTEMGGNNENENWCVSILMVHSAPDKKR